MRLDQLRLLLEAGNLMAAKIVPAPQEPGPASPLELPVQTAPGQLSGAHLQQPRCGVFRIPGGA
jgi:hypothetical protein